MSRPIGPERAERIARAHACEHCGEYSFKKLVVRPATPSTREALNEAWHVTRVCGVCGNREELGLDAEGDVVYVM